MTTPPIPQTQLGIWWLASRPRSLTATYVPVTLGAVLAWADDRFHLFHFVLAMLGVLFLQISANLLNEYFDYARGSDAQKTQGLGMIIARGLLSPRAVLLGGGVTLLAGIAIGLYFVAATGLTVLYIGLGGVLAVILYSAGPVPLSNIGLGEITVFIFMGPLLVFGAYFVQAETYNADVLWASLPIAFLVAAIMHANNLRDLDADAAQNKHTLAVNFGRTFARAFYGFLVGGAFTVTVLLVVADVAPFTTLIIGIFLTRARAMLETATTTNDVPTLHGILVQTAQLHKQLGFTYVAAWAVAVLLELN